MEQQQSPLRIGLVIGEDAEQARLQLLPANDLSAALQPTGSIIVAIENEMMGALFEPKPSEQQRLRILAAARTISYDQLLDALNDSDARQALVIQVLRTVANTVVSEALRQTGLLGWLAADSIPGSETLHLQVVATAVNDKLLVRYSSAEDQEFVDAFGGAFPNATLLSYDFGNNGAARVFKVEDPLGTAE